MADLSKFINPERFGRDELAGGVDIRRARYWQLVNSTESAAEREHSGSSLEQPEAVVSPEPAAVADLEEYRKRKNLADTSLQGAALLERQQAQHEADLRDAIARIHNGEAEAA